jgi:hypothetical protein
MSVTIHPRGNREVCAEISDGTLTDKYSRNVMDFISQKLGLRAMGVYDGDYIIKNGEFEGLEMAMRLIDYEIFRAFNEGSPYRDEQATVLGELKKSIEKVVEYCRENSDDVVHFAD